MDYKTLVQDDRIHASLYTDPRIFADEMERIFHRGWVFVGHESEIPAPGDFVTRPIGTRARHPGARQGRRGLGAAQPLHAPRHAWSARPSAGTRAPSPVPITAGPTTSAARCSACRTPAATTALDKSAHGLTRAPRVASYRGFVFASLHADGPHARGAPRHGDAADRSLVRSLARGRDRADRGLGEAPLRRQLEDAAGERQRRLSPRLRASRAVQDRALAVPARGRRRAEHQGGGARLGRRPHRDRLVARLPGPVRVVRRRLGPGRGRLSSRRWSGATAPRRRGGASSRARRTR